MMMMKRGLNDENDERMGKYENDERMGKHENDEKVI